MKLEYLKPTGRQKDRSAFQIIAAAKERGDLRPDQPVVELTSGNMGTALAMVCRILGHSFTAVMNEGNSIERRVMMQTLGVTVELVPQVPGSMPGQVSGVDPELVEQRSQQFVRESGAWRPNQFHNTDNWQEHYLTTGKEIWKQTERK